MKLSIVIPTRGDQNMYNILGYFQKQTFKDFEIVFVLDKKNVDLADLPTDPHVKYITDHTHTIAYNNASALRNLGIVHAQGEFIQLMDDDEWFDNDFLQRSLDLWDKYRSIVGKDFVLTPTLMYRKTGRIQNQGFSHFNYRFSRPIPQSFLVQEWAYIQMYSGNALLAPAYIFKEHLFDEQFDFVYEDLDFSYAICHAGYPLIVLRDLCIYHMERDKTILEQAWVGNEYSAFRKAKHRILFVKKHGNLIDKLKFYMLGLWAQPLRLMIKILVYGQGKQRWVLIKALWKGMVAA